MKPPKVFKLLKNHGYSLCIGCGNFKHNNIFHHEGTHWVLCKMDYEDYWENTEKLEPDYKGYL